MSPPPERSLDVVVDGVVYEQQARGGISRMFSRLLPLMCEQEPRLHVELRVNPVFVRQALPAHARIRPRAVPHLRPVRLWERALPDPALARVQGAARSARRGPTRRRLWHTSYYTTPFGWAGPRVVSVYDMIHERFAHALATPFEDRVRAHKRVAITSADAVVCISEATRRDVAEAYGLAPDRLHVVHLGYDDVFRPLPPVADGEGPFVLYVGNRTAQYKGFDTLLEGYARWPRRADVALVAVGPAWNAAERAAMDRLGIAGRVRHAGELDDDGLARLYNAAAAFVYPSLYEGFGIPLLEAMACGCPVVASRIPSSVEVAADVPLYFEPGDPDGLADALDRAVGEGRASDRTARGLAHAATFSWARSAAGTLAIYHALLG